MKITKGKLIAAGIICVALAVSYVAGGGYAVKRRQGQQSLPPS